MSAAAHQPCYVPRDRAESVVAEVIREYLGELQERIAADDPAPRLPGFVLDELRAISTCGDFTSGFAHFRCDKCHQSRVVPLSCKSRLCPSCAGRRMSEQAAHLVDRVLRPDLRWRQWVFTFPRELAVGLCFRSELASAVIRVCMRVLFEWIRDRTVVADTLRLHPAAVVHVQRFSDGAGVWFHLHVLMADGVFCERPDSLDAPFVAQPPPTDADVALLARRLAGRVQGLLRRRRSAAPDADISLLHRCADVPARTVREPTPPPTRARRPALCTLHDGFGVHAAVSVAPGQPAALERLCRYLARPAVPESRLRRLDDGRVALSLKRTRRGVREFIFDPIAFVARLAALVPPPRWPLTRFYGALSPGSSIRDAAVPDPPDPAAASRPVAPKRPRRMLWADLLARVFFIDALLCPCGGRLRPLGVVRAPDVVQAILAAIVLSSQAPARAPPLRPRH